MRSCMILLAVFIEIKDASHHCNSGDPCFVAKEMYQPYARAEVCVFNSEHAPCDRYLTPGWYKSDEPLLDRCPELLRCGAVYPVWLNGSLPNTTDGTVSRKTCRVGFNNSCSKEYEIKIKLCGSFYVFCFPSLDSCSERFCFGRNGSCEYPFESTTLVTENNETKEEIIKNLESKYIAVICILSIVLVLVLGVSLILYIARKKKLSKMVSQSIAHLTETRK